MDRTPTDPEGPSGTETDPAPTGAVLDGGTDAPPDRSGDRLLDLLERWEERYRRGEDVPPDAIGAEPSIRAAFQDLIDRQKRLYAGLGLGPPASDAAPEVPAIPGHEILDEIGRGGMGIVYKARDLRLGRVVAIKAIAEGRRASADQRDRFWAEAQAVARLRHPNIFAIHSIDEHEGSPYLSLEFAEGGSRSQRLAEKPMAPREAAELVATLADAVHAAHQAGVVHRDLKPSNILLTGEGIPKVSDFGLAKLLDVGSERTRSDEVMGSPSYMSPEQAEGRSKQVGLASDIYALGTILYQALTGRPPFLGESALETLRLVTTTDVVAPRLLRPDVPRDLETICLKCLEKEAPRRYRDAEELAAELRRYLEGCPIAARPVGPLGRLWRWSRRNPGVAALSASVALSLILGTVVSTAMAIRATRAEAATASQRDQAELEARRFKTISAFLRNDLLAQASATNQTARDAAPDPDLKVRTALDRAAARIGDRLAGDPIVEASIRQTIGETYYQLGLLAPARTHLERALALLRETLGPDDPENFRTMHVLGTVFLEDGRWTEAEPYLVPAMSGLVRADGPEALGTLEAISGVAELWTAMGKYPEAEAPLARVIDGLRRTRGETDASTLRAREDRAVVYLEQLKYAEAEPMEEEVIAAMSSALGPAHPYTLIATSHLAMIRLGLGKSAEAERLFLRVIEDMRRILGARHPARLTALVMLADLYRRLGRHDETERYAAEALEGSRTMLHDKHQVRATALGMLSTVYVARRDRDKLEQVLTESVELTRYRWGPGDMTADGERALGSLLIWRGKYASAEPYFREDWVFLVEEKPDDPMRAWAELHLGVALLGQKKPDAARPHLIAAYNRLRPPDAPALPEGLSRMDRIVDAIRRLRDGAGRPFPDSAFEKLRSDPLFQALVFDPVFPVDVFAPE